MALANLDGKGSHTHHGIWFNSRLHYTMKMIAYGSHSNPVASALLHSAICASIAILGLVIYWQLGMQDAHGLMKAAAFTFVANTGLTGLLLLRGRRTLMAFSRLAMNSLILFSMSVEGLLFWLYGLPPKHIVVADALLGTNGDEVREFIENYWFQLLLAIVLPVSLTALLCYAERRFSASQADTHDAYRKRERWVGAGMLTLFIALHFNPTMAKENPLVFWPAHVADYQKQRKFLDDVKIRVANDLRRAERHQAAYVGPEEQMVILVVGESINRTNWSLYGYARDTTPNLKQQRDQLLVFQNVTSSDAATAQSLLNMLTPATLERPDGWWDKPNVLALARAAGYQVFWLSNQEPGDGVIQILAEHANEQVFLNKGHGRETRSLDEQLLGPLDEALSHAHPRKLIVIHMQGAHLRYALRYPANFDIYSGASDTVSESLQSSGRPYWIRKARNEYDNAMRYNDYVLSAILKKAQHAASEGPVSLLYVSDHGQEVGHYRNFAGHSPKDPSGYQIPLLFWTSQWDESLLKNRFSIEARKYRTDDLDHTLLGLLDINTSAYQPEHDVLHLNFQRAKRH